MQDKSIENTDAVRLQLYLARCGVASRRSSEEIISSGRVSVNGIVVTLMGAKVRYTDIVCVDGKQVFLEEKKQYVLLNKPSGYVCSLSDEKDRPVAYDLLRAAYTERLYNVGRLDMFSDGLIIFTNDGNFARAVSHPSAGIEKEYIVETSLNIPRNLVHDFKHGLRIDGVFYRCNDAEEINARRMRVVLVEGKNREIRRVFESVNVGIKRLTRIRIGKIVIGELKTGEFRNLSEIEISDLLSLCTNVTIPVEKY